MRKEKYSINHVVVKLYVVFVSMLWMREKEKNFVYSVGLRVLDQTESASKEIRSLWKRVMAMHFTCLLGVMHREAWVYTG